MAVGYIIDPETGMAAVRTASGAMIPLPLSPNDLAAHGLQGPPGLPPPPQGGPDERLASNAYDFRPRFVGPGADAGPTIPDLGPRAPMNVRRDFSGGLGPRLVRPGDSADGRVNLGDPNAAPNFDDVAEKPTEAPEMRLPTAAEARSEAFRASLGQPTVEPTELAQHNPVAQNDNGQPAQGGGGRGIDPLTQAVFEETLRGGRGGGGPARLGVTGQTRKYKELGYVPDEVATGAREATDASDKYNEGLAKSVNARQEEIYQRGQAEYQARLQAVSEQRAREVEQRRMLGDYEARRDSLAAEAAQMKVPQMEDYWGSKSTMAKMATAISISLGGALQGLRGGPNPGLESSNREIDQWVTAQREAYQRKRGEVDDADNKYARMVQAFGSENLAEQHLREQAYGVRDSMMQAYAQKVGTPSALEAFNQTQLQSEAQRKAMMVKAYQDAGAEIEEKLSMQGGGGGGRGTLAKGLAAAAEAEKNRRIIAGEDQKGGQSRAIEREKAEGLTAALNTIDAADEITTTINQMGSPDDDTDDPRSGAYDYLTKNIPGTESRKLGQNLDQATSAMARGLQQSLGKSDNDAMLADKMATGGGSYRERNLAAQRAKARATAAMQDQLSSMTPEQRQDFVQSLPPDRAAKFRSIFSSSDAPAASARKVQ